VTDLVERIAQAIARFEGFYKLGSVAQRQNNPGNLRSWGKTPVVGGYASFPTPEDGWKALRRQVQKNIDRGLTLQEFFAGKPGVYAGYSPASDDNHPVPYATFVAQRVGISVDAVLAQLQGT